MTNPEHPKDTEDIELGDRADHLKDAGEKVVKAIGEMFLVLQGENPELVDIDELPEEEQEKHRFSHKKEKLSRGEDASKLARESSYRSQSPGKIADRAAENPYIMSDVLAEPSLVDAESGSEAVSKIAEQNPGWAKVSDAVEGHGLEADADGNVSEAGEAGEASGDAGSSDMGAAEAASDAAHGDFGDVSTADAGDLGPTGPAGYGMDGSTGGGDGGSGDGSGSGLGSSAGGSSAGDGGIDGGSGGAGGDGS